MEYLFCLLIVTFTLVQAAPTDPYAADMKERERMGMDCLKQVSIKREVIDRVIKTLIIPREGEDADKYRKFIACSYKKQGFQSDDGKMLYDNIKDFLGRFYSTSDLKGLDICKAVTGEDDGELAVNSMECILNYLKTIDKKNERYLENEEESSKENTI